jgi:CBS domain-containing protein
MKCPACGYENISGVDACEHCLQPLVDFDAPIAQSPVERLILENPVSTLRPAAPICVAADEPLASTMQLMIERKIGCLLVMEDTRMTGIFTERDALMKVGAEAAEAAHSPIRDYMTPDPETIDATASVAFALHKMDLGGYRHLPVMNAHDQPTGVISVRDILRFLTQEYAAKPR